MLKLFTIAMPLLMKGSSRRSVKVLIGRFAFYVIAILSGFSVLAAFFTWIYKTYTLELAFLSSGIVLAVFAMLIAYIFRAKDEPIVPNELPVNLENDALAAHIPESLKSDPLVQKILKEISENPVAATATAATLGMLISRELLD